MRGLPGTGRITLLLSHCYKLSESNAGLRAVSSLIMELNARACSQPMIAPRFDVGTACVATTGKISEGRDLFGSVQQHVTYPQERFHRIYVQWSVPRPRSVG